VDPVALLSAAYRPLIALSFDIARSGDEARGWQSTRLPGWTVRELVFYLASDCQRALVALHTPADRRAIEKNGGVLEDERNGKLRYWIDTTQPTVAANA
jgi:hypothetical protein